MFIFQQLHTIPTAAFCVLFTIAHRLYMKQGLENNTLLPLLGRLILGINCPLYTGIFFPLLLTYTK